MAVVRWIGRFLLFSILVAQAAIFSHYASFYLKNDNLYALVLLILPVIGIYIFLMAENTKQLNWQWLIWLVYVIFVLVPMVILLFRIDFTKKLDKNDFFGPNFLKITICGAPAIAVFLLTTAKDSQKYEGAVAQLCGSIALDSFDELELLEMLLHQEIASHFTSGIEVSIIFFVCISFFLTAYEMAENKFIVDDVDDADEHGKVELRGQSVYILRLIFQMMFVNIPLLTIRLYVWRKYGHDASIFIAKNAIIIVTSSMEVIRVIIENICK
ncbi:uncharacterized protein LOC110245818 [Exaiptasia diaphana]|uniref:Uncharacterized protein n=1 Tax=Exaiptasia diaphana TaxID=2652724 RepID=A0A913XPT5_EXADI|nr:uncharacterized protein LOC110245818 [Exaiptasia diaphana]KXJ25277.1 hypothetical protein AC249_AIPGENE14608 [Exaiptasia diaphana]